MKRNRCRKDGVIMNDKNKIKELKQAYEEPCMSKEQIEMMKKRIEEAKLENENRRNRKYAGRKIAAAVAAAAVVFMILPNISANAAHAMENIPLIGKLVEVVTFRNYQYEDERHRADIEIPELVAQTIADEAVSVSEENVQENLKKSTEEINAQIKKITSQLIEEFEAELQEEEGYQDVLVKSEILNSTQEYFTLKLICYQGAGSGAEWHYFYTINLETGERLQLKDLFKEGADYITPISENIKEQMREQMAADENKIYWLEDEIEEWNFKQITDETAFYVNENGNIVISFNEGDVAPMYMGVVEFVIDDEVIKEIRK